MLFRSDLKNDYKAIANLFIKDEEKDFYTPKNINTWYKELYKYNELSAKVLINKNGKNFIFSICSHPMKDDNSFIVVLSDITALESYKIQLQQQKDDLRHQLLTDNLTSLPNRYALTQNSKNVEICSLAIFNINDFKEINDFYGTKTGDKILYEYGQKINYFAQIYKLEAYKLSGDEYALLFTDRKSVE